VQIDCSNSTGGEIEKGFSGAPVWCPTRKAAVGMVVACDSRRSGEKIAFMVPMKALDRALEFIQRHSLLLVLEPEQQQLTGQITIAYELCRPINWSKPYQIRLEQRLDDLARMTAGDLKEPMLVQFVACLLNQKIPDSMVQELEQWLKHWALVPDQLDSLRVSLLDKASRKKSDRNAQINEAPRPYLIVSVEESERRDNPYRVRASLIRDVIYYDPKLATGAEPLVFQADVDTYPDSQDLSPEDGIPKDKLPVVMACYLDQVGERNIDIQQLTVEFWLPLSLVNEPIEQQPIPTQLGFDQFLAQECGQVMVRLQDRLKETRMLGRWQTKWQRLHKVPPEKAGVAFVPGTGNIKQIYRSLSPDHVLGLRLTRKPQTEKVGELGALIATGTPTALWVRQEGSIVDWESQFSQQIFGCMGGETFVDLEPSESRCCLSCPDSSLAPPDSGCRSISLADLPQQVATVRRNAPDLDEDTPLEQSVELGHHLAFLWEDPNRVPPVSPSFSHDKL
jgi:vWA-MoxR associated protein C-terminal domain/vWA-MoxR associated protein middle region (VMAP-M) 1